jgi:hypothetical protein
VAPSHGAHADLSPDGTAVGEIAPPGQGSGHHHGHDAGQDGGEAAGHDPAPADREPCAEGPCIDGVDGCALSLGAPSPLLPGEGAAERLSAPRWLDAGVPRAAGAPPFRPPRAARLIACSPHTGSRAPA